MKEGHSIGDVDAALTAKLEPEVEPLSRAEGASELSIAISLKRIADALEKLAGDDKQGGIVDGLYEIYGKMLG